MASSSVSQESLDMDDFDTSRRNRIRTHRGRAMPHRSGEREGTGDVYDGRERDHQNGDTGDAALGDHESPTRSAAARLKDKQRSRANHTHKGKPGPKDKRKLREKRRSTGVVHILPSTESTGDSLDDEDDDENNLNHETKKNTTFNEGSTSHTQSHLHHGHTHHNFEGRHCSSNFSQRGNKSPSDLEADLEDNQDYDSTVSHSETNLTLIGRSESSDTQMSSGLMSRQLPSSLSKFSPEASRASSGYRYGASAQAASGEQEPGKPGPSPKASVASLVSRYSQERETTPPYGQRDGESATRDGGAPPRASPVAQKDSGAGRSERGLGGGSSHLTSRFQERDRESSGMGSNSSGSSAGGGGGGGGGGGSAYQSSSSSRLNFQGPSRPFLGQHGASTDNASHLERQLEREKEENKKLQQQLEQKDRRIAELERQVAMLNRECDELDEDNLKLQEENKALIRAMQQLSTNV